jgi:hypothetical protein
MQIPVPVAEVIDRITILLLKTERLVHPMRRANARKEYEMLVDAWSNSGQPPLETLDHYHALYEVNAALWEVEDALRHHERSIDFGAEFVELARSVYRLNDRRAAIKRELNLTLNSPLIEEKSYGDDENR